MIDLDEIRKAIATEHGTWLGENDPVLMQVTINEIILNQYVEMLATQNAEYAKAIETAINAAIQKGIADSKLTAGRVITEGGDYVAKQVRAAVTEALQKTDSIATRNLRATEEAVDAAKWKFYLIGVVTSFTSVVAVWVGSFLIKSMGGV